MYMNKNNGTTSNLIIRGREFTVQGPTPAGNYYLTGPNGAEFVTAQAYNGIPSCHKVISWSARTMGDLSIKGNRVLLDVSGAELKEWKS